MTPEREPGDVRFEAEGASVHLGSVLLWVNDTTWSGSFRSPDWDNVRSMIADRERLLDEARD